MLRVCIASIQNVERSLLLLVVSASDIPLRTIKFFSVLFSSAYWSMLQAVTNKHSLVRHRLCDLHCMVVGNCFCHVAVHTSSNRSIASGAWPTVLYTQLRRRFWHFARPTIFDSQLLDQNRDLCIYPTCIRRPGSGSRRNITTPFGVEKLEWCGYPTVKKNRRYVYSF